VRRCLDKVLTSGGLEIPLSIYKLDAARFPRVRMSRFVYGTVLWVVGMLRNGWWSVLFSILGSTRSETVAIEAGRSSDFLSFNFFFVDHRE